MSSKWVVWSGGYDSTLILYDLLSEGKNVNTLSFEASFLGRDKLDMEKLKRNQFIEFVNSNDNLGNITPHTMKVEGNGGFQNFLPQQNFWLFNSLWYVIDDSEIYFGFHRGDDYWLIYDKISSAIRWYLKAIEKKVEIYYPLKEFDKWEVVRRVRSNGIEDFVWTCEILNEKEPCGDCRPCRLLKLSNLAIQNDIY